ncbi:MAG: hypothetical protein CL693_22100 [Cellvibrionaceae bacterium]|jgi:hypothetical protein|nr:hypothetical protein [Cellvibrionaceae bacterium]|tara:strand:+ start:8788 stop:9000 length:213 start_codon:yes stop_codon:yes gene_type:complete
MRLLIVVCLRVGKMDSDKKLKRLNVEIDEKLFQALKMRAVVDETTMREIIETLVEKELKKKPVDWTSSSD